MPRARRAFTLVELLVVIALIAVLIGLLLPAVQKVRESAARLKCQNNMRQIGLALHGYEAAYRRFPPGYRDTRPDATPGPGWGWAVFILPFVEQPALHRRLDPHNTLLGGGSDTPEPTDDTRHPLGVYRCPSDPGQETNENFDGHATSNYRGVGWGRPKTGEGPKGLMITDLTDPNGVLFRNSRVRPEDVTDGLSATLFVTEVSMIEPRWGGVWAGATRKDEDGLWISGTIWAVDEGPFRLNGPDKWAAGSAHTGGVGVLLGDASVRLVRDGTDPRVPADMATRAGGEVANLE